MELEDIVNEDHELPSMNENQHPTAGKVQIGIDGLPIQQAPDVPRPEEEDVNEEPSQKQQVKQVSAIGTIFNLLNSVLGIGLLSVPNSFINTGVIMSYVVLILMAVLSFFATNIVIKLQTQTGADGFDDLAFKILGKIGSIVLSVLTLLFLTCALLAYMIVAGDMLISWFSMGGIDLTKGIWWRALMIFVYSICLPIPLTIPRNISFLQYFSTATVFCLSFFLIVMIYKCSSIVPKQGISKSISYWKLDFKVFSTLSIYAITFSLPVVTIPSMKLYNPDYRKRCRIIIITCILCCLVVGVTGITGYTIFGAETSDNILNSFENNDIVILIVRICFFVVVTCAYPLLSQAVLGSWSSLIYKVNTPNTLSNGKRALILCLTNGIPLIIAMFLSKVKPALGVSGSLGGCFANYMYPAILYFFNSKQKWTYWKNILAILLGLFGLAAGIISTYLAFVDAVHAFSSKGA
ncbi:Transmembrane amino acid transporter protein [Trichomonas vaginalis G3]|uniref:Transmembrane amino acid transporter protein n=1 Tax=Trichomonas vaginalis (strain ATCC PRA-98 / G3) TaxID=412133 RepID=A2FN59_TRIV3|nr:amino acid transmembrane transporter protein [Trichomonas vaginalis G3]EAX93659.1 Transmembrane amino acid transporter protein [Trichomonas vaginalis G3]KAI5522843.1 amino acid transmembrane transporter protein [Trichomonas vaginalis G3]|eukprot:XP_001306589.1 Transmembrane amino acid transporter protein [Trichomonas vaginalis G3]